jgi:hypothetical protein
MLHLDVEEFFPSITPEMLEQSLGVGKRYLPGEFQNLEAVDFELIRDICFLNGGLAIGSVCAPTIANAVMYGFDRKVSAYAEKNRLTFTRYADDIIISSATRIRRNAVATIRKLLEDLGLRLNTRKTYFMGGAGRQNVTGVVLNSGRLSIGRGRTEAIKRMLYQLLKYDSGDRRVILGHMNFLRDIDPLTFTHVVQKYSAKFRVNVMALLRGMDLDESRPQVAATQSEGQTS